MRISCPLRTLELSLFHPTSASRAPGSSVVVPLQRKAAGRGETLLFIHTHSLAAFLGENAFFSILLLLFEILKGPITRQWELPTIFILVSLCLSSSLE